MPTFCSRASSQLVDASALDLGGDRVVALHVGRGAQRLPHHVVADLVVADQDVVEPGAGVLEALGGGEVGLVELADDLAGRVGHPVHRGHLAVAVDARRDHLEERLLEAVEEDAAAGARVEVEGQVDDQVADVAGQRADRGLGQHPLPEGDHARPGVGSGAADRDPVVGHPDPAPAGLDDRGYVGRVVVGVGEGLVGQEDLGVERGQPEPGRVDQPAGRYDGGGGLDVELVERLVGDRAGLVVEPGGVAGRGGDVEVAVRQREDRVAGGQRLHVLEPVGRLGQPVGVGLRGLRLGLVRLLLGVVLTRRGLGGLEAALRVAEGQLVDGVEHGRVDQPGHRRGAGGADERGEVGQPPARVEVVGPQVGAADPALGGALHGPAYRQDHRGRHRVLLALHQRDERAGPAVDLAGAGLVGAEDLDADPVDALLAADLQLGDGDPDPPAGGLAGGQVADAVEEAGGDDPLADVDLGVGLDGDLDLAGRGHRGVRRQRVHVDAGQGVGRGVGDGAAHRDGAGLRQHRRGQRVEADVEVLRVGRPGCARRPRSVRSAGCCPRRRGTPPGRRRWRPRRAGRHRPGCPGGRAGCRWRPGARGAQPPVGSRRRL